MSNPTVKENSGRGSGSIAQIMQSAFESFFSLAPTLCFVAIVFGAGPLILTCLVGVALHIDTYTYVTVGPLATWEGIDNHKDAWIWGLFYIQAGLGSFGQILARGLTTHLILSFDDKSKLGHFATVWHETWPRLSTLLMSSLPFGAIVAIASVNINVHMFRVVNADSFLPVSSMLTNMSKPSRLFVLRTLNGLIPEAGSPFSQFIPHWIDNELAVRRKLLEQDHWEQVNNSMHGISVLPPTSVTAASFTNSPIADLIALAGSLAAVFIAEAALHFTAPIVFEIRLNSPLAIIATIFRGLQVGLIHFRVITRQIWLLRLIFITCYSFLFLLPIVIWQEFSPPALIAIRQNFTFLQDWTPGIIAVSHSFALGLFMIFSSICDAKLYRFLCVKT